jgi:ribonuclease R
MKTKNTKTYNNLFKLTKQLLTGKGYKPLTQQEILEKLSLPEQHKPTIRKVLADLVKKGEAVMSGIKYLSPFSGTTITQGVLRMHPRGFGFLVPNDRSLYPQDIFIPRHLTQNAVDGDKVEVEVNTGQVSEKGPEGKVLAILERSRTHIAGVIAQIKKQGAYAFVPLLGESKQVFVQSQEPLQAGDRVVLEVIKWGEKEGETLARFSHKIGHILDPSSDISAAIEEYELKKDFPTAVEKECLDFSSRISPNELKKRKDLRELVSLTIDPDTAKDFDDAISICKDTRDHYHLWVHIADVSHYVTTGSEIDKEAATRANSTYFPSFCLPMLPRTLSENLCSLKPKVNRLAATVQMEFSKEGDLLHYDIYRSVIQSRHRFSYREAKLVLDGKKKNKFSNELHLMVELCAHLKKARYERGSIEFSIPELAVLIDERGEPVGTDFIPYDITHQMIEEFMLKANEIVALHLSEQGKPIAYRIHEEPSEDNMKEFSSLVGAFGFKLPEVPTSKNLQELFDEVSDSPYGEYLATNYIRRMKMALYSPNNIGHYGLGLTHYCHFTSPIRRYADLIVHRTLFEEPLETEQLEAISRYCSEQERISEKSENSVILLKKLRLLAKENKENPKKNYHAVLTRIRPFGIYFEIIDLMLEGFLHISELENDYFHYSESLLSLIGSHTGKTHKAGNKIKVQLKSIDFIFRRAEWRLLKS